MRNGSNWIRPLTVITHYYAEKRQKQSCVRAICFSWERYFHCPLHWGPGDERERERKRKTERVKGRETIKEQK